MYKQCRIEQSAKRQREFELALLRLMKYKSYLRISVTDLCKETNVPRNAFYRYFETMDDVLDALLDYECLESLKCFDDDIIIRGNAQKCFEEFFVYWSQKCELLNILEKYELSTRLITRASQMMIADSTERQKCLSVKDMQKICFINSGVLLMVLWHHSGMKQSPREMGMELQKIFGIY